MEMIHERAKEMTLIFCLSSIKDIEIVSCHDMNLFYCIILVFRICVQ